MSAKNGALAAVFLLDMSFSSLVICAIWLYFVASEKVALMQNGCFAY
jgi:hypothetical protein